MLLKTRKTTMLSHSR